MPRPKHGFGPALRKTTVLAGLVCLGMAGRSAAPVTQPIAFNHKAHQDADIACVYCHGGAEKDLGAGIPRIGDCVDCHSGIDSEGKEAAKLFGYADRGVEPEWRALFVLARWNRFSHKAHSRKGVGCAVCHGEIGSSVRPPEQVTAFEMEWCMKCHEEKGASNDCLVCHK